MVVDFTGRTINVGDVIVYAVNRASLTYGMVTNVEENIITRYNRTYNEVKVKVAKIHRNRVWEYETPGDLRTGHYVDRGGWSVTKVTISSHSTSITLTEAQCGDKEELAALVRFRDEIIAGNKVVGAPNVMGNN